MGMDILKEVSPVSSNELAGLRCSDPLGQLQLTAKEVEGQTRKIKQHANDRRKF